MTQESLPIPEQPAEVAIVIAPYHRQGDFWRDHLGLPATTPICTRPEQLRGVKADVIYLVGERAKLSFEMHHAMTWVRRPRPNGREYPRMEYPG